MNCIFARKKCENVKINWFKCKKRVDELKTVWYKIHIRSQTNFYKCTNRSIGKAKKGASGKGKGEMIIERRTK